MGPCDGSDRTDPHSNMSCAVYAPDNTEVTWGEPLSIGSLPKPRGHEAVKGVVSPIQGERVGIRWRRLREPTGESEDEQRRTRDEEDLEDARTLHPTPGPKPESRSLQTRYRDEDRWPRGGHE
ncbi:hypothetical protein NDU88_009368 [Pleurodeles waltl]|uniref:Uncharacterized protein n=1 Tax=Pleurodeles waltl TaxID=8319 RepID=A0AAV7PSJ9_PLEWA|nr:hypothetical protein NDU88_009368 [Pleurodeles waltl]